MSDFSKIVSGTMNWGVWGKSLSANDMAALIETCLENGINTFDHADIYGGYTTEAEFGNAFVQSGINRGQIRLISKCGIQYPSDNRKVALKHYDYSADHIKWSVENSLKNLRTDYLDLLLLHRPSPLLKPDEVAETITRLKSDGKIRDFGVSNFTPSQTEIIWQKIPVSYNQIQFSATHPEALTDGSLDYMQLHNITPMSWNPLGIVFREDTPQTLRLQKILAELGNKYNVSPDVLLIAWILKHPAGILPVIGTADAGRIRNLALATSITLDLVDWFAIWVESRGVKVP